MVRRNNIKLKSILLIGDLLTLNLGMYLAGTIKFYNGIEYHATSYPRFFVVFNLVWLIALWISRGYKIPRNETIPARVINVLGLILFHGFIISGLWVIFKTYYYSREFLFLTYSFLIPLLIFWRVVLIYILRFIRKHGLNYRNIIVYGYGDIATELVAFLRLHAEYGYRFKGFFDDNSNENDELIKGDYGQIKEFVRNNNIDEIYCCLPYVEYKNIRQLIDFGDESLVKIKLLTDFRGFASKGLELQRYEHIPVLNVTTTPLDDWKNRALKRAFDIVFALGVIIFVFSWLFPILALWVKLDSRGPVFFKQKRSGINNKEFSCLKFRSMTVNADSDKLQATKNDSRITRSGKILRKTSLDELPQIFNVLWGQMSIVGPRPHMLSHTEEYSQKIEKFMSRHFVKPGITGLAQAKGFRGETKQLRQMQNRVKLDRFYVDNWSFWLDLKILFLTIVMLLSGDEHAY
jgi:putative colanic acid biosynthesis UDP-glucose lipid carrier transferase